MPREPRPDAPTCPRCGKPGMCRGGRDHGGKPSWICVKSYKPRVVCLQTNDVTKWMPIGAKVETFAEVKARLPKTDTEEAKARRLWAAVAEVDPDADEETEVGPVTFSRDLAGARTFVITSAQNATPPNLEFLGCLKTMAAAKKAELIVCPYRYRNATSAWTEAQQQSEWWSPEFLPYLWNIRLDVAPGLVLMADVSIQPTASEPLSGFDAMTGMASGIVGHPKVALQSIAGPGSGAAKLMLTTGACTLPNYTSTKAGKLGEFHHSYSAVVVEVDDAGYHVRHVSFDSSTSTVVDLAHEYHADGLVEEAERPVAVVLGDVHVGTTAEHVDRATFGSGGIVEYLQPEHIVAGDVFDGLSCNPHSAGDPFQAVALANVDRDDVEAEVRTAWSWMVDRTPPGCTFVAVSDNHGDFLRRWLCRSDWRTDPRNALFYLEIAGKLAKGAHVASGGPRYAGALKTAFEALPMPADKSIRVLNEDESFVLAGVELGIHGNRGPNGSRGSIRNLRRLGHKSVIGHSHTAGISEGTYQVGTSTELRLGYNAGPSSWSHAHCVVHANSKRQMLFIRRDGAWRRG